MNIGVINQITDIEKRVLLTPIDAGKLIKKGHEVCIESGSGIGAFFTDNSYTNIGAHIMSNSDIVSKSDIILSLVGATSS